MTTLEHARRPNELPKKGAHPVTRPGPITIISNDGSALITKPHEPQTPRVGQSKTYEAKPAVIPAHLTEPVLPPTTSSKTTETIHAQPQSTLMNAEETKTSENEAPVGFYTARAAQSVQSGSHTAMNAPSFNPRLESPSIRKTTGVDHSKSKPVNREAIGVVQPSAGQVVNGNAGGGNGANNVATRSNFVNPQTDKARKVGMPMSPASPMQNRGAYKPPQLKRPPSETNVLRDVTATSINTAATTTTKTEAVDVKRQKLATELT